MTALATRELAQETVRIPGGSAVLYGELAVPESAKGLVLLDQAAGSARPTELRSIARQLQETGFATLLFDLLASGEDPVDLESDHVEADVDLLALRLVGATKWAAFDSRTRGLPTCYFGTGAGSAIALLAAARLGDDVTAVVSCCGRPDLADTGLRLVVSPTLLITGDDEPSVTDLNREAAERMLCEHQMAMVPEDCLLENSPRVGQLATAWFEAHLTGEGLQ